MSLFTQFIRPKTKIHWNNTMSPVAYVSRIIRWLKPQSAKKNNPGGGTTLWHTMKHYAIRSTICFLYQQHRMIYESTNVPTTLTIFSNIKYMFSVAMHFWSRTTPVDIFVFNTKWNMNSNFHLILGFLFR